MFDYILHYQSKELAQSALPAWFDAEGEPCSSATHAGIMSVDLVATEGLSIGGYNLIITTPEVSESIYALDACMVEMVRPSVNTAVSDCITRAKPTWRTDIHPEPEYSGSLYVWKEAA